MAEHTPFRKNRPWNYFLLLVAVSALGLQAPPPPAREATAASGQAESISAAEFSRLIQAFSEEDGYFRSDNFTSNETSYLHVVDLLRENGVSGGAYVGVGPEQNFTYIAKVRPRIAFIVDIRRQAMIQHLLYKAIFETADTRAEFLSGLLCRPLAKERATGTAEMLAHFKDTPATDEAYAANLARVRKTIQERFRFPLSARDQDRLEHVYGAFRKEGLGISFRFNGVAWPGGFPTLEDLILGQDLKGRPGNFLASEEDYRFVRDLQRRNRVIPVVGDFAGSKALSSVGAYLRKHGHTVSAFYTSNVEQFLFQNQVFAGFAENVRRLPIDSRSVFIRAVPMRGQPHPAYIPGNRTATILQKIGVFLKDYDEGVYGDYWTLLTTHYIAEVR
jgi:hypothetical protein